MRFPTFNNPVWVWDESVCGSNLIVEDNGKVVREKNPCTMHQSFRAKIALENKGIFEWDIIIEKYCVCSWIGICASENFNYEEFAGSQQTGWVLGSSGSCCHSFRDPVKYCPSFKSYNSKVTVHLDMNKRTCAFIVNGIKYPAVSGWDLPSKLYPVVSLCYPGKFRIQFH